MNGTKKSCMCDVCKNMCKYRPCWPTPDEADDLLNRGLEYYLMEDYWEDESDINIICPAIVGYGGHAAPSWPVGRCVFLSDNDLCILHNNGKPLEGREAIHNYVNRELHGDIAKMWDTPQGRKVVRQWRFLVS
jgi:hypothetical protein